jgi:hypothetical protein
MAVIVCLARILFIQTQLQLKTITLGEMTEKKKGSIHPQKPSL